MPLGYDNYRPNQQLLLDLQFRETTGTITHDWAKPYHTPATLTGTPAWTTLGSDLTYLAFDSTNPDYLSIPAADTADLDFTTGDFSGAAWFYPDTHGERYIFNKGTNVTGWAFGIRAGTWEMLLFTRQAGPTLQVSYSVPVVASTWQFVGFSRAGASCRLYVNGRDRTTTPGTHVDPASSAAQNFYVGCSNLAGSAWIDGNLWRPRVWDRAVTAGEMLTLYNAERDLFDV